jgi:hypothetical protein
MSEKNRSPFGIVDLFYNDKYTDDGDNVRFKFHEKAPVGFGRYVYNYSIQRDNGFCNDPGDLIIDDYELLEGRFTLAQADFAWRFFRDDYKVCVTSASDCLDLSISSRVMRPFLSRETLVKYSKSLLERSYENIHRARTILVEDDEDAYLEWHYSRSICRLCLFNVLVNYAFSKLDDPNYHKLVPLRREVDRALFLEDYDKVRELSKQFEHYKLL